MDPINDEIGVPEAARVKRGVALVTGASRGVGPRIAQGLADVGWAVAVNYAHDDAGATRTVVGIRDRGGVADRFKFDVTDATSVVEGVASIAATIGPVDMIVNNATGPQGAVPIADQDWVLYSRHLDFFVKAPLVLLQAVLTDWRHRKTGRIINIGSSVIDAGSARDAHYVAAKSAMLGLTRSWASELGPEGITVNMVSPGWTPVERHVGTLEVQLERYTSQVPLRRMGVPNDLAGMVAFIASPSADFITGQNFRVNGGRHYG